jgi:hypothetical protein
MSYERYVNKEAKPTREEILEGLKDSKEAFINLEEFLEEHYQFPFETNYTGKNYGWCKRYRKSGKTLCSFYPEEGAFTVLIILGKKEGEEFKKSSSNFSTYIIDIFNEANEYHDGRWLWIRVKGLEEVEDIKKLLLIKKKPKN